MSKNSKILPGSSLELLLDTMCNTFGGVMFIAISLVVIISMLEPSIKPGTDSAVAASESAELLRQKIAALRVELENVRKEQQDLNQMEAVLANDPRQSELSHLAALEKAVRKNATAVAAAEAELRAAKLATAPLQKCANELKTQLAALAAEQEKLTDALRKNSSLLEKLRQEEQKTQSTSLVFTMLEKDKRPPYWIILSAGKIWRIGPPSTRIEDTPEDDVFFLKRDSGTCVSCTPKPEAGTPVFENDTLSTRFLLLLRRIPDGRVALFLVAAEDAPVFSAMREQLKKLGIRHGFQLVENNRSFEYFFGGTPDYVY